MRQIACIFDLITREFTDNSSGIEKMSNDRYCVLFYGYCDSDVLSALEAGTEHFTEKMSGVYIAVVFDKTERKLYVFHDRSTSSAVLYYVVKGDKVYIGTSLKTVLGNSGIDREFNEERFEEFLVNGFIYGGDTLVKNVRKLKAFTYLEIAGSVSERSAVYPLRKMNAGEALTEFDERLSAATLRCFRNDEINMPLSGGYDSNYIAYTASKTGRKINAFSIGGKHGRNELPTVEQNVKYYAGMTLYSALTDSSSLKNLPDIVSRLEGAVFENGLFLQYELNKLVASRGKTNLVCGECADQVMNMYYFSEDRIFPQNDGKVVNYEFSEYPYIFGNYLILKKNGILANSFDIETYYPYLDNAVLECAEPLGRINMKDKRVHVANCTEKLPAGVIANMQKVGGATDCHSLFDSSDEIKKFFRDTERSEFFQRHADVIASRLYENSQKQHGITKLKTGILKFVKRIFGLSAASDYYNEEIKLRQYISVAYMAEFERQFIKG